MAKASHLPASSSMGRASGDLYHGKSYLSPWATGIFMLLGDEACVRTAEVSPRTCRLLLQSDLALNRVIPIAGAIMTEMMGEVGSLHAGARPRATFA